MSEPGWKKFERRIAGRHGGRRKPNDGSRQGSDTQETGAFVIQCKLGRSCPTYLRDWLDGIRAAAARHFDKTGIVVWKPRGARDDDALVLIALKDWIDLHGPLFGPGTETGRPAEGSG